MSKYVKEEMRKSAGEQKRKREEKNLGGNRNSGLGTDMALNIAKFTL